MELLPKTMVATSDTFAFSARNSYASATESDLHSARNSYLSISDIDTTSARTSFSSIPEYLNRVASFSRTSDSYVPDSTESSPTGSRGSSPNSPTRWQSQDPLKMVDQRSMETTLQSNGNSEAKDGPSALKELRNVKNVLCVAFGAFDRYYISWEDNDGNFHQESHNLPTNLHNWLFPASGQIRHIPTLQVSFGSNDDFFASDQDGKFTSRGGTPPPRLAEVARGFMRRKANSISSPKTTEDFEGTLENKTTSSKLERRRTFLEGQPSPRAEIRQSIIPLSLSLHSRRESRSGMPKIEESKLSTSQFVRRPSALDLREALPKAEKRKDAFAIDSRVLSSEKEELLATEPGRTISPPAQINNFSENPERMKSELRRSTINCKPRPVWPERESLLSSRERILSDEGVKIAARAPYVDASVQTEFPMEKICAQMDALSVPRYMPTNHLPPRHSVTIGSMADFFRGQYRLGDALRFV